MAKRTVEDPSPAGSSPGSVLFSLADNSRYLFIYLQMYFLAIKGASGEIAGTATELWGFVGRIKRSKGDL